MKWANLDMENDEICLKMQQKNDQMKKLSTQVTQMELDLVKTKQELGDALNQIHELATEQDMDPKAIMSVDAAKSKGKTAKFLSRMSTNMFKGKGDKNKSVPEGDSGNISNPNISRENIDQR